MFVIKGMNDTYVNNIKGIRIVHSLSEATKWETRDKASNVLVNSCMRTIIAKYKLMVTEVKEQEQNKKKISYTPEKTITKVSEDVGFIKKSISELEVKKQFLHKQVSDTEKEICDLLHIAEIYNLNACQGYKLYKEIQKTRRKRRQLKNEIDEIDIFLKTVNTKEIQKLERKISGLYKREYRPRILNELFK